MSSLSRSRISQNSEDREWSAFHSRFGIDGNTFTNIHNSLRLEPYPSRVEAGSDAV